MKQTAKEIIKELNLYADPDRAVNSLRFFKTGKGQYGEGDKFIGITMPSLRNVCKGFSTLSLDELQKLLDSPIHEYRMAGVVIMANQYRKAEQTKKQALYDMHLKNLASNRINNWDLIDVSCPHVVGAHATQSSPKDLYALAVKPSIWQKRVAIISTFAFLAKGEDEHTYKIAKILLQDRHDLIQKAVGWSLREAGKRCSEEKLCKFLDKHAATMPRTSLRYAIERLSQSQKQLYMHKAD